MNRREMNKEVSSAQGFSGPGVEVGEQGLYHLPKDHAWHGGPTYYTNDFQEWHYFTFQGTDKKTGHYVTVFWTAFSAGWDKELNRPFMNFLFAWHDTVTGEFINTTIVPTGKFVSSGSGEPNFGFKYSLNDDDGKGAAWGCTTTRLNAGTSSHSPRTRARSSVSHIRWS